MKPVMLILFVSLIVSCDIVEPIEPDYNTVDPIDDKALIGTWGREDNLGICRVTFNDSHRVTYYRFWAYSRPAYKQYQDRYLTFNADGTIDISSPYGYAPNQYEAIYDDAVYSVVGNTLTIGGQIYTKGF